MFVIVRLFLGLMIVFVSLGCGANTEPSPTTGAVNASVQVTEADSDGSGTLNPDDTLQVVLTSNATTGYHWTVTSLSQGILQQTGDPTYRPDPNPQGLIGAGGKETFTFKAVAPGETVLKMNYQSPSNTPSDTNFNYSVKVS